MSLATILSEFYFLLIRSGVNECSILHHEPLHVSFSIFQPAEKQLESGREIPLWSRQSVKPRTKEVQGPPASDFLSRLPTVYER